MCKYFFFQILTEEEEEALANAPPPVLPYSSMFIFSSENGFRCAIHSIVTFPLFDVFIMLVIIASSISLAAEDPVNAGQCFFHTVLQFLDNLKIKHFFFLLDSEWNQKLVYFDYGFTCVFAIEVLMKIIDYGVILHPGSYLRELWNVMDMLVVSCAISSFTMDML